MARDPKARYAESLERALQHNYEKLKEMVDDFKGLCMVVTPERVPPQDIITNIRKLYKEIRDRLAEIRAIQQVLQGKYRQYYRRDGLRDKSLAEIGFLTKNLYSKFEFILHQKQALERQKEEAQTEGKPFPSLWFRLRDHQVTFIRNLRLLNEFTYEDPSNQGIPERRAVQPEKGGQLTLFTFKGDPEIIHRIHTTLTLREHDILERYAPDELRGLLLHLRSVDPVELQRIFQRMLEKTGAFGLKVLLIPIRSDKELERDLLRRIQRTLEAMEEGGVFMLE
ncbi:MAG: hypothetical protein N3G78_05690 [Desulfobacterota bacterium]|nr:hypothetical protein [Thermodesulfobacteriota bacterium]